MPKYRVSYETGASTYVDVDAETEEDAIDKAEFMGLPSLCAHCSGWNGPGIELGDWEPVTDSWGVMLLDDDA